MELNLYLLIAFLGLVMVVAYAAMRAIDHSYNMKEKKADAFAVSGYISHASQELKMLSNEMIHQMNESLYAQFANFAKEDEEPD